MPHTIQNLHTVDSDVLVLSDSVLVQEFFDLFPVVSRELNNMLSGDLVNSGGSIAREFLTYQLDVLKSILTFLKYLRIFLKS